MKITQAITNRSGTVERYLRDVNRCPLITPEEEFELTMRIREGDEEALRQLVSSNLRFAISVSKNYQGCGLDLDDLISEANIGLIKAAMRYDPTRGFKFITYAVWWIRQSILQGISEKGRMVRLPLNQLAFLNRIGRLKSDFQQENGREPTDAELAELADITPEKLLDIQDVSQKALSFDTPFGEDGDGNLLDVIPDTSLPSTDAPSDRESLRSDISDALSMLPQREREIVMLSFGLGGTEMSLEEIGERYQLTRERVRQLRERAVKKIARSPMKKILAQYI